MVPLLSAFYFGSTEHYRLLAEHPQVIIDTGEHYERQSYRTRTGIMGPNGRQDLSLQVVRDHGRKMPMRSVRLSYAETWPQQHLHAIRSAYGQTSWFIHYIDDIEKILMNKYEHLVDLQLATIHMVMRWLRLTTEVFVAERYVEGSEIRMGKGGVGPVDYLTPAEERFPIIDLRACFHPKKPLPPEVTPVPPYAQTFADRHGFQPRLSVIDLVCNLGPRAQEQLRAGT